MIFAVCEKCNRGYDAEKGECPCASPASDCSALLGEWTIDLLEDGSLRVQATGRGSHRVLTFGDASNSVNVTTEKIVKRND